MTTLPICTPEEAESEPEGVTTRHRIGGSRNVLSLYLAAHDLLRKRCRINVGSLFALLLLLVGDLRIISILIVRILF